MSSKQNLNSIRMEDYFIRRNEIFARAFEVFIKFELEEMGINNRFLTSSKYNDLVNMKDSVVKLLISIFKKLLVKIRRKLGDLSK